MSYTTPDFADDAQALLAADGYQIHEGADDDTRDSGGVAGYWFTLTRDGWAGIETGPICESESAAWLSALEHRLETSTLDEQQPAEPGTVTLQFRLTDQACYDLMCTAAEGGINYWADITSKQWQPSARPHSAELPDIVRFEAVIQDGPVTCDHPEIVAGEIDAFMIDPGMIRDGIRRLVAPGAQISPAIRNDAVMALTDPEHAPDADTADAIVQFSVFGEVVFG